MIEPSWAFPVGLFGEHTNTMAGRSRATNAPWSSPSENPSPRGMLTTSVAVVRAMYPCIA